MKVKRYEIQHDGYMEEDEYGEYVRYDDYAELLRSVETMQHKAELWEKHSPAIQQMLAALDILSPLVLTRLKLQDAAEAASCDNKRRTTCK